MLAARSGDDPATVADRLSAALGTWAGDPYGGLEGHQFLAGRQRIERLRVEALISRQQTLIELGRAGDGLADLIAVLGNLPIHEGLVETVMMTHYYVGDQHKALALFDSTRRRLRDELGLSPSPQLAGA